MSQLSFRQRFPLFLSVALPALAALGTGRLLANVGEIYAPHLGSGPLSPLTRFACWVATTLPVRSLGATAAIAIASLGFLVVRKSPPERLAARLLLLVTLAWLVQFVALMLALIGFALPFARV